MVSYAVGHPRQGLLDFVGPARLSGARQLSRWARRDVFKLHVFPQFEPYSCLSGRKGGREALTQGVQAIQPRMLG